METFELYLANHTHNLILDLKNIWACKYPWKFSPALGVYTVTYGKKQKLLSLLKGKGDYYLLNGLPYDYREINIGKLEVNQSQFQKLTKGYTSKYKGVSFSGSRKNKPWLAQKSHNGQRILQSYFSTEIEAAMAYNKATIEALGHEKAFFGQHLNEFVH
jgi:hypothetical protein